MTSHTSFSPFKKLPALATAAMLCLSLSLGAVGIGQLGHFRNLTSWTGSVIGTVYERATQEIQVGLSVEQNELSITAVLLFPQKKPYHTLNTLSVGRYQITDRSGTVIVESTGSHPLPLSDGEVTLTLPLPDVEPGHYQLLIHSFVGEKKADQPLEIQGRWSCGFAL